MDRPGRVLAGEELISGLRPVIHWVTPAVIAALVLIAIAVRLRVGPSQRLDDRPGATLARAIQDSIGHGDGFEVVAEWKEIVHYWEGETGYRFDAGWGVTPLVLYVPAPEIWSACVPGWMQGRRDEIVDRLRAHSGHDVVDTMSYDPDEALSRAESRETREP